MANTSGGTKCLMKGKEPIARWTKVLLCSVIGSTIGAAVPGGYCIGIINSPAVHMRAWCNSTLIEKYGVQLSTNALDTLWALIVSIFLIGGVVGSGGAGWAANRFGRRGCFLLSGVLMLLGATCFISCRWLKSVELLLLGRLIVGLGSGLTTPCLPMYHSEIAAIPQRGSLGACCAVGFSIGLVLSQILSLQTLLGGEQYWHLALSFYVIFMAVGYTPFFYYAESPKWLFVVKQQRAQAYQALERLRGQGFTSMIDQEMQSMESEAKFMSKPRSLCDLVRDRRLLLPLFLLFVYQGGQPLSGVNAIFFYSVAIFQKGGLSASTAEVLNLCAGFVNLTVSMLGPLLIAKFNRRTLMLLSTGSCAVFLFGFAPMMSYSEVFPWLSYGCMSCVFLYLIGFQLALGPMPSFIGAEIFDVSSRGTALSVGNQIGWSCNFLIGMIFPIMHSIFGAWIFLFFSMVSVLLFVMTKRYLPETRGKEIADVAELISDGFASKINK